MFHVKHFAISGLKIEQKQRKFQKVLIYFYSIYPKNHDLRSCERITKSWSQ